MRLGIGFVRERSGCRQELGDNQPWSRDCLDYSLRKVARFVKFCNRPLVGSMFDRRTQSFATVADAALNQPANPGHLSLRCRAVYEVDRIIFAQLFNSPVKMDFPPHFV